jgi:capsular polysaccharide biosynthesis protein
MLVFDQFKLFKKKIGLYLLNEFIFMPLNVSPMMKEGWEQYTIFKKKLFDYGVEDHGRILDAELRLMKGVFVFSWLNVIHSKENNVYENCVINPRNMQKTIKSKLLRRYPIKKMSGVITSIEYGPWDNYYHWYIDSLPRIYGLYDNSCREIEQITLLLTRKMNNEEFSILKALLPENVVVKEVSKNIRVKPDTYIFLPFLSGDCSAYLPEEYLDFYTDCIFNLFEIDRGVPKTRKIFLSRREAKKRKLINEDEVSTFLQQYGFETYQLENLTIKDQVELFNSASVVIGQHGAGLTNLLYSSDAKVIEIFAHKNSHLNHYRHLAKAKKMTYTPIFLNGEHKNEDVLFSMDLLEDMRVLF